MGRHILKHDLYLNHSNPTDTKIIPICSKQPSVSFFILIKFLWTGRFIGELSAAKTLITHISSCPLEVFREDTVDEKEGVIKGVLSTDRIFLMLALGVPRFLVAIPVFITGCEYLALTRESSHLLWKAVV